MSKKLQIRNSTAEFLIFTNQAKEDGIEVRLQDDTIWLSQKLMATLFDCSTDNIGLHLKNIFKEGELEEGSVTEQFSVTASDGKSYSTLHRITFRYKPELFSINNVCANPLPLYRRKKRRQLFNLNK